MAVTWEDVQEGYDVTRFVGEVKEDILCLICKDVPKNPRLCRHKDHFFCLAHISQHLQQNSQTCPYCRDPLTLETLRRPAGFLKNYLDDRKSSPQKTAEIGDQFLFLIHKCTEFKL